ncbi:MAG: hypothetical protein SNJ72_07715 [Fimbriimonadales bacterium]
MEPSTSPAFPTEVPLSMLLPTLVMALLSVGLGIFAVLPLELAERIAKSLLGAE